MLSSSAREAQRFRKRAWMRAIASASLAVLALLIPGVPMARAVALAAIVNAALTIPVRSVVGRKYSSLVSLMQDQGFTLATMSFIPELWASGCLVILAGSIWSLVRFEQTTHKALGFVGPVLLVVVGAILRPEGWVIPSLVTLFLVSSYVLVARGLQRVRSAREEDLAHALSTSGAIVHVVDLSTAETLSVDGPVQEITGWTKEEWMTLDHQELLHPDDLDTFWVDFDEVEVGDVIDRKARFRRPDGEYAWIRDVSRVTQTASGRVGLRGISMDVTAIEKAQSIILHQAETDALTGLANRSVLMTNLESLLAEGRSFGLVLLDVDQFKQINDTFGHGFGDGVLIELGRRLSEILQGGDVAVRLGGDEFAIICKGLDSVQRASEIATRLVEECSRPIAMQGVSITTGASVGIALSPRDGDTAKALLRHADIAMYAAKGQRRRFQVFNASDHEVPLEEVELSAQISPALENDEFVLHFQPKVNTVTGEVVGFEGLARWEHPELGLLAPNRFIHLAMVSSHAAEFSDRILDLGGQFAAEVASTSGRMVPISVNISARTLYDSTFPDRVARVLARHKLKSSQLMIEITEHDIMNKTSDASGVLARLGQLGVALSIDDFGTGYSSLARLMDLPVSEIKIDRRFIFRLFESDRDAVVVRSIIDLARNLDLDVIAEGIEDHAEANLLQSYGCLHAQGFLYSRPVPVQAALESLAISQAAPVEQDITPIWT